MCFTNVNEGRIRYRYFMYSTNKCTDFNKNITQKKKKKVSGKELICRPASIYQLITCLNLYTILPVKVNC